MSLTYPAAVPATAPTNQQPATVHYPSGESLSSKEQSDDKLFPLIGPLL